MINPLIKYDSLNKALKEVGFDLQLPKRYKLKEIYVINHKILEIRFASFIIRKAKFDKNIQGLNGISGVYYGAYPNDCNKLDFNLNNIEGYQYWNSSAKNPRIYLAVWNDLDKEYSYSIYAPKGLQPKTMALWQEKFK